MDKKTANFIDSYSSLPLGSYLRILDLIEDKGCAPEDLQPRILAVLSGLTEDEVLDMQLEDYMRGVRASAFLRNEPSDKVKVRKYYDCGTFRLVPVRDFRDITAAQYIDFQGFAKDGRRNFVELLSCMLVPEGRKYGEGYDPVAVHSAIREHMNVPDGLSLHAFFLSSLLKSMRRTLSCSMRAAWKAMPWRTRMRTAARLGRLAASGGNGDGFPASMPSAKRAGVRGRRSGR